MKKSTVMIICLLLLALLVVGCGKQVSTKKTTSKTTTGKTTGTTPATTSPSSTEVPPGEDVKEINYEAIFHLQYCNATIGDLDFKSTRLGHDIGVSEQQITKEQNDLTAAQAAGNENQVKLLQNTISSEKKNAEDLNKQLDAVKKQMADKISKCSILEKKIDTTVCKEFVADAQKTVDLAKSELNFQQKEVDTATSLNQQDRLVREKRQLTKNQIILKRVQTQYDELAKRCGISTAAQ